MLDIRGIFFLKRRATMVAAMMVSGVLVMLIPAQARAHFVLNAPASWMSQDASGTPQKLGPCGNEPGGTPTNTVTAFQAGQTIAVQWTETVSHTGWYRIALSYNNRTDFVDPPAVIAPNGTSADAGIENPPVAPVLADGLFPHISTVTPKAYTYMLTLPAKPCAKCTLQVIQFMNSHGSNLPNFPDGGINPDGYFYHHCADISISAPDGGTAAGQSDAGAVDASGGGADSGSTLGGQDASLSGSSSSGGTSSSSSGAGSSSGNSSSSGGPSSSSSSSGSVGASSSSGSGSSSGSATGGGNSPGDASTEMTGGSGGGGCAVSKGGGVTAVGCVVGLALLGAVGRRRRRR